MTAKEIIEQAIILLGYTNRFGTPDGENYAASMRNAIRFLNTVCLDITAINGEPYHEVKSLNDTLPLSDRVASDVAVYGLAMWIAKNENDADNQSIFSGIYSQKRSTVPRKTQFIKPVFGVKGHTAFYKKEG